MLQRLVDRLRPANVDALFTGADLPTTLCHVAEIMLDAALSADAIALSRLILAEASRFPELAAIAGQVGARDEAVTRIAALLQHATPGADAVRTRFAAEQFLQMVIALPQRRALGLGAPLGPAERRAWARDTVALFLGGYARAATT